MLRVGHLNLTVTDLDRSTEFYSRWFGFDRVLAEYPDGARFLTDRTGFELALHPGLASARTELNWHFGFLAPDGRTVRELVAELLSEEIPVADPAYEQGYVGFKCLDPDGHVIEVYWEPRP